MNNGQAAGQEHGAPMGTEYTLQGVMRFLQMEWHNHERQRNAWDIEREEMKQKIASQEGKIKGFKHTNSVLERCVKVLEKALKDERSKNKTLQAIQKGEQPPEDIKADLMKGPQRLSDLSNGIKSSSHFSTLLDIENAANEAEKDAQLEKSRKYLTKCVEEITYLLLPPSHPPPPQPNLQSLANSSNYLPPADHPMNLEEAFMQQRQKNQSQQAAASLQQHQQQQQQMLNASAFPEVSQLSQAAGRQSMQHSDYEIRDQPLQFPPQESRSMGGSAFPSADLQTQQPFPQIEPIHDEKSGMSLDPLGRPVSAREDEQAGLSNHRGLQDSADGFVFEETAQPQISDASALETAANRRPGTDLFPSADSIPVRSPPRAGPGAHRRKSSGSGSMARRRSTDNEARELAAAAAKHDPQQFKVRFALRGHLDVVRSVIFTGGGSPAEPEICTAGDDGMIKRWIIPASYGNYPQTHSSSALGEDLDIQSYFTHRGHDGMVTSLAACPSTASFATGGRVSGDGWIFSGGQDATIRVWERGRVDPKATLEGHTDAVWAVCMLPATASSLIDNSSSSRYNNAGPDRVILASGSADGTIKIWAVSAPPQITAPQQTGSRRGVGGSRRHSVTSGSNYPSSPQPSVATSTPFKYTLIHSISRLGLPSPTCISPLSPLGENFVVSYNDASILIFDTRTGEEIAGMASTETYDGTPATGVNAIVATALGNDNSSFAGSGLDSSRGLGDEEGTVHGATGSTADGGVEGVVISGHDDRFIRFFDANSGQCTYSMLAHPSSISSLSLSRDGREAVSAGHDASIRFWNLEKRVCTQMISSHRIMRGEGVCAIVWSQDGRLVVSGGGDGVVKVYTR